MRRTEWILSREPSRAALALVVSGAVVVLFVGDLVTGPYVVFATFYFAPVLAAAWYQGFGAGAAMAIAAAVAGALSTVIDPGEVTAAVIVWNAISRFAMYAVMAWLAHSLHRTLAAVRDLASVDALTGAANRRRFMETLDVELERARRHPAWLAVAYVDLDDLKERNDTLGHDAGDQILTSFVDRAGHAMRATDVVARLGGDEFGILMPGSDHEAAEAAMQRLFRDLEAADSPIRASAGVVVVPPGVDQEPECLVKAADSLMLGIKRSGKAKFVVTEATSAGATTDR